MSRQLAYADPPYPGQASRYENGVEVNLPLLVDYLRTFDGWALSTSASALREVWNVCPEARCAAWLKTWATNGWSRVRYSWEPVLFVTDRRGLKPGERSTVWDGLVCAPVVNWSEVSGKGGGAKPPAFIEWLVDLLEADPDDSITDIFPGSGRVARAIAARQMELAL